METTIYHYALCVSLTLMLFFSYRFVFGRLPDSELYRPYRQSRRLMGVALLELSANYMVDYKTRLQEIVQQNPEERLSYVVESESGPDHDKHFVVAVRFNSDRVARGEGRSKKAAEQCAAKEALKLLGVIKEK